MKPIGTRTKALITLIVCLIVVMVLCRCAAIDTVDEKTFQEVRLEMEKQKILHEMGIKDFPWKKYNVKPQDY